MFLHKTYINTASHYRYNEITCIDLLATKCIKKLGEYVVLMCHSLNDFLDIKVISAFHCHYECETVLLGNIFHFLRFILLAGVPLTPGGPIPQPVASVDSPLHTNSGKLIQALEFPHCPVSGGP